MKYLSFFLLFGIGCGEGGLLQDGIYEVTILYTKDTFPMSMEGQTTEALWDIREDDGKYTLWIVGTASEYTGKQHNYDSIVFKKDPNGQCSKSDVLITLRPETTQSFLGNGSIVTAFCSGGIIVTEADFYGEWRSRE